MGNKSDYIKRQKRLASLARGLGVKVRDLAKTLTRWRNIKAR